MGDVGFVSDEFDLHSVVAEFISFVPSGANRKQYLLVKEDRMKEDILKAILETPDEDLSNLLKEAKIEGEAADILAGAAALLKSYKDKLPENALELLAKGCGYPKPVVDAAKGKGHTEQDGDQSGKGQNGNDDDSQKDDQDDSQDQKDNCYGYPATKEDLAKMDLDPKTRVMLEKALDERDEARANGAESLKIAKELKDEKILKEYQEKTGELKHLPVTVVKHAPIFKTIGEAYPQEFAEILNVLKAAERLATLSDAYKEIGKHGEGAAGSAEATVYEKARGLVGKSDDLTFDEAVAKVLEDEPELYARYEEERQEAVKRRGGK
ncbi:Uncharacterised protein [uncultured archaeon]|nr:Uncharacterised protein [uncultured archaeon]